MATYGKNNLYMVSLAEIQRDPNQPCKYFDPVAQMIGAIARLLMRSYT